MAEQNMQVGLTSDSTNGAPSLETRLRHLFAEQGRLRELLDRTRAELDAVNREVLKTQDDFCTDAEREEEYRRALQRVLGFDPHIDMKEIEEAKAAGGPTLGELIEELERAASASSSREPQ